ncbi:hypothetical protein GCM10023238_24950 [Streptomyces heliomycini]
MRAAGRAAEVVAAARDNGVNLRLVDADHVSIACDETTTRSQLAAVWSAFGVAGRHRGPGRGRAGHRCRTPCCATTST